MDASASVLYDNFHLDNTLSRFQGDCPRCFETELRRAHTFDELNGRLRTFVGCCSCHFKWEIGRKYTNKELNSIFVKN
jgi:hypothetical protein